MSNTTWKRASATKATLSNFFTKRAKKDSNSIPSDESSTNNIQDDVEFEKLYSERNFNATQQGTSCTCDHEIIGDEEKEIRTSYDIGKFIGNKSKDDCTKEQPLINHWKPPKDYVFPYTVMKKNGKNSYRRPSLELFTQFDWLALSESRKGLFCIYCALFTNHVAGGVPLKNLVVKPVIAYKHLLGKDGYLMTHTHRMSITEHRWKRIP